jgi:hypothetical protein
MLYFHSIERSLWRVYRDVTSPTGRPDHAVAAEVEGIVAQAVLCRCTASVRAIDLYRQLVALHRPALAVAFAVSDEDRAQVALGLQGNTLAEQLGQIRRAVGTNPVRERAFDDILAACVRLTDDAALIDRFRLPGPDLAEAELLLDPSRPGLWVEASLAHRRSGSLPRSLQLLRRAASSGFAEAEQAGNILSDWVASVWGKSDVTAVAATV